MLSNRSRLWIISLVALALAAIIFNARSMHRVVHPSRAASAPPPVIDSGGACEPGDFPRDLDAWLPDANPTTQERQRENARRKVVACIARKLYPSASVQFGYTQQGKPAFDLTFADRSFARLSSSSYTILAEDIGDVIHLIFMWPTSDGLAPMPPLVIARSDREGNLLYYRSLPVDAQARISSEQLPKWGKATEDTVAFEFDNIYLNADSETQIHWSASADVSQSKLVRLVPTDVRITRAGKTLRDEKIIAGSMIGTSLELNMGGQMNHVTCTYAAAENCVVDTQEVVSLSEAIGSK